MKVREREWQRKEGVEREEEEERKGLEGGF